MDKDIQTAAAALFYLVTQLEPRFKPLSVWYRELVNTIEKWRSTEGSHGVKRAKDILNYYFQYVLGENPEPLPFVSTTKEGIPCILQPLHRVVKGNSIPDARFLSLLNTICRTPDLFRTNPTDAEVNKSLDIIQESRLTSTAKKEIEKFSVFVNAFLQRYSDHPIVKEFNNPLHLDDESTYLYKKSKGPNGPLMESAHLDICTLKSVKLQDGRPLLEGINSMMQHICAHTDRGQSFTNDTSFSLSVENAVLTDFAQYPGKLSLIREKAAKTRVIAQPDYYSQLATRPIRRWLENILKALTPMDVTFKQETAIPRIQEWLKSGGYIASFDHSSCTDLFPFDSQLLILKYRFGTPFMESFKAITVDRDWSIKMPSGVTRTVRWHVGQPLGMHASWSLMAVTHHLLVQYAYHKSHAGTWPKTPFQRYVICGDDIVIADKATALKYRATCRALGMRINESKSHISGGDTGVPPVAEFTKKIMWKGELLYPIKPNLVLSAIKDARNAIPLLHDLADQQQFSIRLKVASRFINTYFRKESRVLTALLTVPRELGGIGYRDSRSFKATMLEGYSTGEIHPFVYFIGKRLKSYVQKQMHNTGNPEVALERLMGQLPIDTVRKHPMWEYHQWYHKHHMYARSNQPPDMLSVIDYVCDLLCFGYNQKSDMWEKQNRSLVLWDDSSERERQEIVTAWFQAFRKTRYFAPYLRDQKRMIRKDTKYKGSTADSRALHVTNDLLHCDNALLIERQYNLILNTILGQRFRSPELTGI